MARIAFLGNFGVSYSSENHHKRSLEALSHEVIALQEGSTSAESVLDYALESDLFVWVHTHGWDTPTSHHGALDMVSVLKRLRREGVSSLTYHLDLWKGLAREKDLAEDSFYRHIEHFFTVDKLMADWFNENTEVKGHYLRAGVFHEEAYMAKPFSEGWGPSLEDIANGYPEPNQKEVIFVGSRGYHPEYPYRPQLIDWLKATYGKRFGHYSGEAEALGLKRGADLNQLYADSKVAVGDTLCLDFKYPYYWSDRIYETTGRGGFIIHPYIRGLEEEFEDGKEVVFYEYGNLEDLKAKIDYYLKHENEREKIREAGFKKTKNNYTYKHRWETILETVGLS